MGFPGRLIDVPLTSPDFSGFRHTEALTPVDPSMRNKTAVNLAGKPPVPDRDGKRR